mgnify:CR=1 FL=1
MTIHDELSGRDEKDGDEVDPFDDLAELERGFSDMPSPGRHGYGYTQAELEQVEAETEKCYEPVQKTPYDRALEAKRSAEHARDIAKPGTDEYHAAMSELAEKNRVFKLEQQRALDPTWRRRRETDAWRSGPGRDDYNASRRRVRDRPNKMTEKNALEAMTDEERHRHIRDQKADSATRRRARRKFGPEGAGLTGEQLHEAVEREVAKVREARLARRDRVVADSGISVVEEKRR